MFVDGHLLWVDYEVRSAGLDIVSTILFGGHAEIAVFDTFFWVIRFDIRYENGHRRIVKRPRAGRDSKA